MNEGQILYQVMKPAPIQTAMGQVTLTPIAGAATLDAAFSAVQQLGMIDGEYCIAIMVCLKSTIKPPQIIGQGIDGKYRTS